VEDVDAHTDLDRPARYEIQIRGRLDEGWSDWFDGMVVTVQGGVDSPLVTTLTGVVPDQSALLGILTKIAQLNLTLLSVVRTDDLES
jgi:hypothetical protein